VVLSLAGFAVDITLTSRETFSAHIEPMGSSGSLKTNQVGQRSLWAMALGKRMSFARR
jgi:hypothetical protein